MGVLYLVEFPFLLWYISTKVMAVDRRGLNRKQCILNMLKSVGCAGMVLFMQVASWYLVYFFICLSRISSACNYGTGCFPDLFHPPHCKHSTSSPSMSYTMQKVSTAKCSHCVTSPDSVHLYWIYIYSGICFGPKPINICHDINAVLIKCVTL